MRRMKKASFTVWVLSVFTAHVLGAIAGLGQASETLIAMGPHYVGMLLATSGAAVGIELAKRRDSDGAAATKGVE